MGDDPPQITIEQYVSRFQRVQKDAYKIVEEMCADLVSTHYECDSLKRSRDDSDSGDNHSKRQRLIDECAYLRVEVARLESELADETSLRKRLQNEVRELQNRLELAATKQQPQPRANSQIARTDSLAYQWEVDDTGVVLSPESHRDGNRQPGSPYSFDGSMSGASPANRSPSLVCPAASPHRSEPDYPKQNLIHSLDLVAHDVAQDPPATREDSNSTKNNNNNNTRMSSPKPPEPQPPAERDDAIMSDASDDDVVVVTGSGARQPQGADPTGHESPMATGNTTFLQRFLAQPITPTRVQPDPSPEPSSENQPTPEAPVDQQAPQHDTEKALGSNPANNNLNLSDELTAHQAVDAYPAVQSPTQDQDSPPRTFVESHAPVTPTPTLTSSLVTGSLRAGRLSPSPTRVVRREGITPARGGSFRCLDGVHVTVLSNGLGDKRLKALQKIASDHGAQVHELFDRKVTHIVSALDLEKTQRVLLAASPKTKKFKKTLFFVSCDWLSEVASTHARPVEAQHPLHANVSSSPSPTTPITPIKTIQKSTVTSPPTTLAPVISPDRPSLAQPQFDFSALSPKHRKSLQTVPLKWRQLAQNILQRQSDVPIARGHPQVSDYRYQSWPVGPVFANARFSPTTNLMECCFCDYQGTGCQLLPGPTKCDGKIYEYYDIREPEWREMESQVEENKNSYFQKILKISRFEQRSHAT
eukprot:c762_g1_i1.p1 GENE.c762_g1_i1~~c762_g1_i1.p1  ORF type:complete len:702 (+),score=132.25 c762_g1_i1:45-2150(+)